MTLEAANAITSFLRNLELGTNGLQLADLAGGEVLADLLAMIDGFELEKQKIAREVTNWTVGLNNIKLLLKALENYYERVLGKALPQHDIEAIEISKNRNEEQLIQLFGIVLGALTQSSNKEFFIQQILKLPTEHQQYFAEVIRKTIKQSEDAPSDDRSERKLLEQVSNLEEQNSRLRVEMCRMVDQQARLEQEMAELESKLEASRLELETVKLGRESSSVIEPVSHEDAFVNQQKHLIEKLKEKLLQVSMEHEKQLMRYKQEMEVMEAKVYKIPELEAMVDMYKENYEEALEHLNKINVWEREKQKMSRQIEQYVQLVSEKTETVSDLNEKVYKLQQELLESQIEHEKLTVRYNELESQLRRTLNLDRSEKMKVGRHTLTQLCPQMSEDSYKLDQATREIERKNKRLKDLERDVSKYKAKADRVYQLEKEKMKLETIIVDFNQSKSEEVELLVSALYELRLKYGLLVQEFSSPQQPTRALARLKGKLCA